MVLRYFFPNSPSVISLFIQLFNRDASLKIIQKMFDKFIHYMSNRTKGSLFCCLWPEKKCVCLKKKYFEVMKNQQVLSELYPNRYHKCLK